MFDPAPRGLMRRRGRWLPGALVVAAIVSLLGGSHAAGEREEVRPAARPPDCLNAHKRALREFPVRTAHVRKHAPGRVLPGRLLADQTPRTAPFLYPDPLAPHYPGGRLPSGPVQWRNTAGVPRSRLIHETHAGAVFNAPGSKYEIAFN